MPRLVYTPQYNIGLAGFERLHPFDSRKYGRAWKLLQKQFPKQWRDWWLRPERPISKELLAAHSAEYLLALNRPEVVAKALELPFVRHLPAWLIDWAILRPMRWGTAGTVLAAETAAEHGLVINLSGGYHHAKPDQGEGFSIYADVAIAIHALRQRGRLPERHRIAYIDLDAHQGNGVCRVFRDDPRVFIFDMFNADIYPSYDFRARERIDCAIPLHSGTGDPQYLGQLFERLPPFLESINQSQSIDLAFYNAGTDIFAGDPLGGMNVSAAAILERDAFVIAELRQRNIPTAMVLSGGYTKESYRLIADSIVAVLNQEFDRQRRQ